LREELKMTPELAPGLAGTGDRLIVGLMTGSSLDGISAALVATCGHIRDRSLSVPPTSTTP